MATEHLAERFLVTGALGCIGAWTVKRLVEENVPVWTYDLGSSTHRLRLIMDDAAYAKINFITGDITDLDAFERVITDQGITHVVHLAALQVPLVRANPVLGAQVNVVGMTVVLEALKRHKDQIRGFVYASSVAAHGPSQTPNLTASLYGVHKQAKEGMARIYYQDYGLRSMGLRPHTVYGPGRDQGVSSTPTKAMLAAAVGRPYEISYGGMAILHHTDDIASVFIQAARANIDGFPVYDVGGNLATLDEVVDAINAAAPDMAGKITHKPESLPVPSDRSGEALNTALGGITWTPLREGVHKTVEHFRTAAKSGKIDVEKALA